jgi:hypothetical protein
MKSKKFNMEASIDETNLNSLIVLVRCLSNWEKKRELLLKSSIIEVMRLWWWGKRSRQIAKGNRDDYREYSY